jgi:DNA primase
MLISPEKLSQLKDALDIVEVVSDYMPLKKAGKRLKALCPFHPDKDPSFYVNPERQNYRCFGCGASGDVISFVQAIDHLSFVEAVHALARRAGIEIEIAESSGRTSAILRANEFACRYYLHVLWETDEGKAGREYLEKRGIGRDIASQFRLGYAPAGWESLKQRAQAEKADEAELVEAGLLTESSRGTLIDFFRQRLLFPIFDSRSRVIAFGGRVLDDSQPKYLNSRDMPLFKKSETLYGLNFAKAEIISERSVVVTEGYTDVIKAHEKGIKHAVATLGTAFTDGHARALRRFTGTVYVVFDSDSAGRKAAERSLEILLGQELGVRVVQLPGESDLFDYLSSSGKDEFRRLTEDAVDFLDFKYDNIENRYDLRTTKGRAEALDELLPILNAIRNQSLQNLEIQRVLAKFGGNQDGLRRKLAEMRMGRAIPSSLITSNAGLRDLDLIDIMINRPDLIQRIMEVFPEESYVDGDCGRIASLMCAEYEEKGTISTDCVFQSEDGERLRAKVLEVIRYAGQHADKDRDYEKLFTAWVARKEEERLASEIRKKSADAPAASLVEYFELKKKISRKHKV